MNKKLKKILIGGAAPMLAMPTALTVLASCGKSINYNELSRTIQTKGILEFVGTEELEIIGEYVKGITQFHRPTFHTKEICDYLVERIGEIMNDPSAAHRDDFHRIVKQRYGSEDGGDNIYFDIPATNSSMASFILQCHTDMVWENALAPTQEHPNPEIIQDETGQWIIHTEGELTSLGADDGMGVGTVLALARIRNQFEHGKIRILLTTDEEKGVSGASAIPSGDPTKGEENWFYDNENEEYFQYLVNIDLEESLKIATSCGGTQEGEWFKQYTPVKPIKDGTKPTKLYQLNISDLAGGHSAFAIPKNHANSIKLGIDLLDFFCNQESPTGNLQLYKAYEYEESSNDAPEPDCSRVPKSLCIQFFDTQWDENQWSPNLTYIGLILDELQKTDDKDAKISVKELDQLVPDEEVALTFEDTNEVINIVKALPHGFIDEEQKGSANLGAIRLFASKGDGNDPQPGEISLRDMGRSADTEILGDNPDGKSPSEWNGFMGRFYGATQQIGGEWTNIGWTPPWGGAPNSELTKSFKEAANRLSINLEDYDEPGWFEVAFLDFLSHQNIDMAAIGYKLTDVHTHKERLYLESLDPTIKLLLYVLQHAPVHHTPYTPIDEVTRKEGQYE